MKLTKKVIIYTIYAAFALAILIGCAKPPTEEMNNATEAVTRAENDQNAVTYASNSVNRAKDALAKMNSEAASKRYDAAKSYAAEAIAAAERAITEGRTGAERARNDAAALVAQLPPLLAETEQGMNAAKAAGLPLEFDSLDREYATARSNAGDAQFSLSNSRYQDAINQGQNARAGLNSINQQLSNAVMAVSRKK